MIVRPQHVPSLPVIDMRHNGIGDVVVACWLIHSAHAAGLHVLLNPRQQREVAAVLSIPPDLLTSTEAPDWSTTDGLGHLYEYGEAAARGVSRFDAWCESLHLPQLTPVRPRYDEQADDAAWADEQWRAVDSDPARPRVLVFPDAAWNLRQWPKAYYIDLVGDLVAGGAAVAAMSADSQFVSHLPCRWWVGFSVRRVAAMMRRATLVIANDSGPAHLAGAVGTSTIAICGPTDPAVVFAHDTNIRAVLIDRSLLPCAPCHFSGQRGYRRACDVGGCQALMRLDPRTVGAAVAEIMAAHVSGEVAHA